MKEQLITFIEKLKVDKRIKSFDEAATKQAVILRLLSILGWDTFNIEEVKPEYSVSGKSVDYSLRIGNSNKVFLEIKRIGEVLEKHQEQLLNYSFKEGVKLAALTNGITWWFYLPLYEGSWERRRFYTIDILQQDSDEIALKFIDFLSRDNIATKKAIQNAETVYKSWKKKIIIKDTLPEAWNRIIESDELIIDLLAKTTETLCGYKPDSEMVEKFLSKNRARLVISPLISREISLDQKVNKKKRQRLSYEELQEIADRNGVGDIYKRIVQELQEYFNGTGRTKTSITFIGIMSGKRNKIFSLHPSESNLSKGVHFQIYIDRFLKYFNITKEDALAIFPSELAKYEPWRGAPPILVGYFKNVNEVDSFLKKMTELKK